MGASQFVADLFDNFPRKACFTRREFYRQILQLFMTFRHLPGFPRLNNGIPSFQELDFDEVAKYIGEAAHHATLAEEAKDRVNELILQADSSLVHYMKKYCPKPYHQAHHEDMKKAKASDEAVVALMRKVKNALQEQTRLLQKKPTKTVDLCVSEWREAPKPRTSYLAGKIKIEEDATLSMLIYRYMDYKLHFTNCTDADLQLLSLNPQIYPIFPVSVTDWDSREPYIMGRRGSSSIGKYIPCVNPATTIRAYQPKHTDQTMFLVFDRYDGHRHTIGANPLPPGFTTGWFLEKGTTGLPGVVRKNSLDYTLYYWDFTQKIEIQDNEVELHPNQWPYSPQPVHNVNPNHANDTAYRAPKHGRPAPIVPPQQTRHGRPPAPVEQAPFQPPTTPPINTTQPHSHHVVTPPRNTAAPPVSRDIPGPSSRDGQQVSANSDAGPPQQIKTTPGKTKSKPPVKGPDAIRREHRGTGGPNEMIDEENRGGWFGSLIKTGLQKLGAYGGSPKR